MGMAAIYSQSPLWHQMLAAREGLQYTTVPRGAREGYGVPCLPGLPGLPVFPFMTELHSLGAPTVLQHLKQEMLRGYLRNLAQSTLHGTTSGGGASPQSPSTQIILSTSKTGNNAIVSSDPSSHTQTNMAPIKDIIPSPLNYTGRNPLPPTSVETPMNPLLVGNQTQQCQANLANNQSHSNGGPRRTNNATGKEKVFTCTVCNRSFGYKHVLQNHSRTHTGEKPFECKVCHKRFTRNHHLNNHMRLHTGEKPYSCPHCDRHFIQAANLRQHLRVYTRECPYKCDWCPRKFSDSNQLKAHIRIHNGEKPFSCDKCFGKFRRRHHLTQHACPMEDRKIDYKTNPFINEKEELLVMHPRHSFPQTERKQSINDASSTPKSRDAGSEGSPTPGENQESRDKRRSRKQKPRRVFQWTEEIGGHASPRSHSRALPEQTEPEDRTVFRNNQENIKESLSRKQDTIQEYQRERIISQYSIEAYKVKQEDPVELEIVN